MNPATPPSFGPHSPRSLGIGGPDDQDRTILDSAARESGEETQIWSSKFAGMALTCAFYHTDRKTGNLVVMRTLAFIINDNEETMAGRWEESGHTR
jgi:hypothetical protein